MKTCSFTVFVLNILFEGDDLFCKSEYMFNKNSGEYFFISSAVNIFLNGIFINVSFVEISSIA